MNRPRVILLSVISLLVAGLCSGQTLGNKSTDPTPVQGQASSCPTQRSLLLNFAVWSRDRLHSHEVPVWHLTDSDAFLFVAGMAIDADGAPNAYEPDDNGLDELGNAGSPAHWDGIITDRDGNPFVQGDDDPFPGYYISCTSLADKSKQFTDPARYVDASEIPYIALPPDLARNTGAELGDFAVVMNLRNGKTSYAIFADIGTLGEGSIALADNLEVWSDPRVGGVRGGILYLVFPGSGNHKPRTLGEIEDETEELLDDWGGLDKLSSCAASDHPAPPVASISSADDD